MSTESVKPARELGFDVLRGFCIVLVITWHAWLPSGGVTSTDTGAQIFQTIMEVTFALRMPALMFAAGYFANIILGRKSQHNFLVSKAKTVLYPAVIWTMLMAVLVSLSPSEPHKLDRFLHELIQPTTHPWFLQYLTAFFAATLILWNIGRKWPFIILAIVSLGLVVAFEKYLFFKLLHFYAVGFLTPIGFSTKVRKLGVAGAVALIAAASFITIEYVVGRYDTVSIGASYLIILGALSLCERYSASRAGTIARGISGKSLEWYLLHWPLILVFSELSGIVAPHLGYGVRFLGNLVVGFLGTWIALAVVDKIGATWIFRWPGKDRSSRVNDEPTPQPQ